MSTESGYPDYVYCPLVDHDIEAGDCMENRDVVAGNIKSSLPLELPEEYAVKENWKEICRNCRGVPFGNRVRGFILTMVFYKSGK